MDRVYGGRHCAPAVADPRSAAVVRFALVEPGFVLGVVRGMSCVHEKAVLGGGRSDTLSVVGRSASVLVGRCAVVAAQLQTAHHKEFAELSVPRDAP